MYVATRGLYRMAPPTIIVPTIIKESVEKIFEAHRTMDQSELKHTLIGLDVGKFYFWHFAYSISFRFSQLWAKVKNHSVLRYIVTSAGEEFYLRKDLKQGYVIYSVKQKLKPQYVGLPGDEIKKLKFSGVEITYTTTSPEVAFTGDTTSDFIVDTNNADVLKAKILIMEVTSDFIVDTNNRKSSSYRSTYVENTMTVENARDYGHTHLSEIINYSSRFENKAILLIHFSARYQLDVIQEALSALHPPLAGRVFALTEGF
ncbi:hypothetical protein Ccrd_015258 [Cynara cardunculus var. scolymus]|uniref:Uncharacterized protein n=1 Tax=Cynara cardunculus var. scolymus TaxID=59895 RepID=A0A103YC84_CYNCS|nr:hypothetical protein Ccrd_015258 [Cynara cardunculus var. scolymus]